MTLDDPFLSQREELERDRERDHAAAKAEYDLERLIESEEAEAAHWVGVFRQSAAHWSGRQHWGSHG